MADLNLEDLPPPVDAGGSVDVSSLPPPVDVGSLPPPVDAAPNPVVQHLPAPVDAPYDEEEDAWEKVQGIFSIDGAIQGAKKAWKGLTGTASLGLQGIDMVRRLTTGNIIAALDPEAKRKVDKALEAEGKNPKNIETFYDIDRALNTVAPDLYVSTYLAPKVRKGIKDVLSFKDKDQKWESFVDDVAGVGAVGVGLVADIVTDPLTYLTFGASIAPKVAKVVGAAPETKALWEAAKTEGRIGKELMDESVKNIPKLKSFVEQVQDGEKAVVALKIPFKDKVLPVGSKEFQVKAANALESIGKSSMMQNAKRKFSFLQTKTGFESVDNANTQHSIGESAHKLIRKELAARFPETTKAVDNVVNAFADYGEEKGLKFLKDSGVEYTEQDLFAGKRLYQSLQEEVTKAKAYAEMHGVDINAFEAATADERKNLIEALKPVFGGSIPKEIEPYLFREQYGLPRQMKREAVLAEKTLAESQSAWDKVTTDGGILKMAPSSAKESEKYSTIVMDKLKQSKTGMVQSFEASPVQRTLDRIEDIYRSVADKRYVDTIKKYGGTREELVQKINEARTFVKNAKAAGTVIPAEIRQWASVNPKNLRPIGEYPWNRVKGWVEFDKETQDMRKLVRDNPALVKDFPKEVIDNILNPGQVRVQRENILFPPEIVVGVENRLGIRGLPQENAILRGLEWINNQWKKSTLLNPLRLFREGGENAQVYIMMGGNVKYLRDTAADLIAYSDDVVNNKASAFTTAAMNTPFIENIATDPHIFKKPMTYREAVDINTDGIPFSQIMHDSAKTKRQDAFDALMGLTKDSFMTKAGKVAMTPVKIVELINDNKLFKAGRNFFGGAAANLNKIAYAKTLHFDKGIPFAKAMQMADEAFISFHDVSSGLRKGNLISPFLTYHARNIQRMPVLFASSPAGFTFYNKIKQAWYNASGWDAEDQAAFKHTVGNHFQPEPVIGPLIRGTREMLKDSKWFAGFGEYIGKKVFGDDFKSGMDDNIMVINVPDPFRPAADFLDPERAVDNLSPLMKAALAIAGTDPFTGDALPYRGTELDLVTRAEAALKQINPFNFTQGMKLFNVAIQAVEPKFVEHLVKLGMDEDNANHAYDLVYGDGKNQQKRLKEAYGTIFNWSTLGFGRVTNVQVQAAMKTIALSRQVETLMKDYKSQVYKKGFSESQRIKVVNAIKRTMKDIEHNAEMISSYHDAIDGAYENMATMQTVLDSQEEASKAIQSGVDDGFEEAPTDLETPEEEAPEYGEPQSYMPQEGDRSPAMASGSPRESELLTRGSSLTQANLEPRGPMSDEEKQRQQESVMGVAPEAPSSPEYGNEEDPIGFYTRLTGERPKTDTEAEWLKDVIIESIADIDEDINGTLERFLHNNVSTTKFDEDSNKQVPLSKREVQDQKDRFTEIYNRMKDMQKQGATPENILEELHRSGDYYIPSLDESDFGDMGISGDRGPASHRAVELGSGGAAPGGGGGFGAAIGMGLAAPFIKDKTPPEEQMGMGSGMSQEERRLYLMSPSQLAEQPDSAAKQKIKDIKSMESPNRWYKMTAVPSRSHLPGYEEIIVDGDILDKHSQLNKVNRAYLDNYWVRQDRIGRRKDEYISEGMSPSSAEELASKEIHAEDVEKFGKQVTGVKAWARGFAPTPDTFLITEVQRNPKDKKATEEEAIDKAIEYARKAGYKNIGIADAESVAQMQGHSGVKDWVSRRYDKNFIKHMSKELKQSPSDKQWVMSKEEIAPMDEENGTRVGYFADKFNMPWEDAVDIFYNYKGKEPDRYLKSKGVTKEDLHDLLVSREYQKVPVTNKVKYKVFSLEGDKKK